MRRRITLAVVLALLVLLSLLVASWPAAAHPYHLMIDNEVLSGSDSVDVSNWVAQSILAPTGFFVSRISLFVANVGTGTLNVSLHPDGLGAPSSTVLTRGIVAGPSTAGWVDFDMTPYVQVSAGKVYWIVARSLAPGGQGYGMWNSGTDTAYLNGTGARSGDGISWSIPGKDYAFRVYGFVQPSFVFSVAGSATTLRPADTATFSVNITNTGSGSAAALWVNVSLASALTYVSDDATNIGGVRSGAYSFAFVNVNPGTHLFNLSAIVKGGIPHGTVATTAFTLQPTDHNGVILAATTRNVAITILNARLTASIAADRFAAGPGEVIALNSTATNVGSESASNVVVDASIDANTSYVASLPAGVYNAATRTVEWVSPTLGSGLQLHVNWTVRVLPGTPDLTTIRLDVLVSYQDPTGTVMPPVTVRTSAQVQAPTFSPVLRVDRSSAERNDVVGATLYFNNTGSATATMAWANWTLGSDFILTALVPSTPFTLSAQGFQIVWTNLTLGPHSITAQVRVVQGLQDGLPMPLLVGWTAADQNRNLLPPATAAASVRLSAPSPVLTLDPPSLRVGTSSTFTVDLTVRNGGQAAALGWLNASLPLGIAYVGDNGSFAAVVTGSNVTWTIPSLAAGSVVAMRITLRTGSAPEVASIRLVFDFTDGRGSAPQAALSNAVSVDFSAATPIPLWPWSGLGIAAGVAAPIVLFVRKRRASKVTIEDVFVADRSGVLLAHRSSTIVPYQDDDILVGMFKVVQDFVRDSFGQGTGEEMKSLEVGDRKVMIEQGARHFVAVVYRGRDRGELQRRLRSISMEIEKQFGSSLADWDGSMETVKGITLLLGGITG